MERRHVILLAAWVAYMLIMEACLLVQDNIETNTRYRNSRRRKAARTVKWTAIACSMAIAALTVKQTLF